MDNLNLELREFVLSESYNYKIILYQAELLRIYNILIKHNSLNLASKIKRIIFLRDYNKSTITDFNKTPFKGNCANLALNYKDFSKYIKNTREFDEMMEDYYDE